MLLPPNPNSMNQNPQNPRAQSGLMTLIFKAISVLEVLLVIAVVVGAGFKYLQFPGGNEILFLAMAGLATIYFLSGYRPPLVDSEKVSAEKKGFFELFVAVIAPKFAWIGCSVVMIGVLFAIMHLKGALEMLMIGTSSLLVADLVMVIHLVTTSSPNPNVTRVLYRAVPLALLGLYVWMNTPPN